MTINPHQFQLFLRSMDALDGHMLVDALLGAELLSICIDADVREIISDFREIARLENRGDDVLCPCIIGR